MITNNALKYSLVITLISLLTLMYSCENDPVTPDTQSGKLGLEFSHMINSEEVLFDTLAYVNEAGNEYLINEIQYFISDVSLYSNDGSQTDLFTWNDIIYIDTDISETKNLTFKDDIDIGEYSGISFTFGIKSSKNNSLMFVNPPQSFMFWPENLGGGYHYLKLNGKWLNEDNLLAPFNFHLGIGQIYHSFPDSITSFVDNSFDVKLEDMSFSIKEKETTTIKLIMDVDSWFKTPHSYDHNIWGGDIMQKQDAMLQAVENGHDVFSYGVK